MRRFRSDRPLPSLLSLLAIGVTLLLVVWVVTSGQSALAPAPYSKTPPPATAGATPAPTVDQLLAEKLTLEALPPGTPRPTPTRSPAELTDEARYATQWAEQWAATETAAAATLAVANATSAARSNLPLAIQTGEALAATVEPLYQANLATGTVAANYWHATYEANETVSVIEAPTLAVALATYRSVYATAVVQTPHPEPYPPPEPTRLPWPQVSVPTPLPCDPTGPFGIRPQLDYHDLVIDGPVTGVWFAGDVWRDMVGDELTIVASVSALGNVKGMPESVGDTGMLYVDACNLQTGQNTWSFYYAPQSSGALLGVVAEHGLRLELRTGHGSPLYFDVIARQFVPSLDATPLPPSPTSSPYP
jgi:hypothetical protein